MRFAGVAVVMCLVLSGCGGGDSTKASAPASKATPVETQKAAGTAAPTVAAPTGVPAPEDLTDFLCLADDEGVWDASGTLRNESKKAATYRVTVFVGEADGNDAKAATKKVRSVLAGGSSRVSVTGIPADDDATQCYVQVLRKQ
jgi:hypothetical protein